MASDEKAKGKPEVLPNGAVLYWVPHPWERWSITSAAGEYQGLRPTYEAARAFALTLPGEPYAPPQEPTLSRSPRAAFPQEPGRIPPGAPREERRDFNFAAPPQGAPAMPQRDPFAESRALSRRQAAAHDRVYGRRR
jgi:hypothetical protein